MDMKDKVVERFAVMMAPDGGAAAVKYLIGKVSEGLGELDAKAEETLEMCKSLEDVTKRKISQEFTNGVEAARHDIKQILDLIQTAQGRLEKLKV